MPRRCLFDAHCHLQLRSALFCDAVPRAQRCGVAGAAVCGCHATDWEKVEMLYQQLGQTLGLGLLVQVGGLVGCELGMTLNKQEYWFIMAMLAGMVHMQNIGVSTL